ncbi:hypothetical protein CBR_g4695 [Chara braunii]|uniref:Uncharacterized protein n=1 Tax=Chara braunii TaxID=69332 RepID=A0A388KIM7_CHABU|nr:hypothetical protein CBR_g4695 [Chara braunii]|eukprot:GBG69868.1 hypothetical protein CBR_g4695 [Chara braunii]
MMTGDVVEEEFGDVLGLAGGGARDGMGVLGKATDNNIDAIVTMVDHGETTNEVRGDRLPAVGGYGERLEFANLGLVGSIDGLASRARTDVGFDVGKERGPVEVTGDMVKGFLETEVSDSLGVVVLRQELCTDTTDGMDAKAAGFFGVNVEEMVEEVVVRDNVKVAEFGVGRGEVRAGSVAMGETISKRLGQVDMSHGRENFLGGLVIGSAREGIDNMIGLVGSMANGEEDGNYILDVLKVGLEAGSEGGGARLNESFFKEFIELALHLFNLGDRDLVRRATMRRMVGFEVDGVRYTAIGWQAGGQGLEEDVL